MSLVTVRRGSILTTPVDNAENRIIPDFEFTVTEATEEVVPDEVVDDDQSLQVSPRNSERRPLKRFRKGVNAVRAAARFRPSESYLALRGAVYRVPQPQCLPSTDQIQRLGDLQDHVQLMFGLLQPQDTIKVAIQVECPQVDKKRYLVLVSTAGRGDTEESAILGVDIRCAHCDLGLVMPLWSDTRIRLLGDGGFSVTSSDHHHSFKPVSVQTMWAGLQGLCEVQHIARRHNYYPHGITHQWTQFYERHLTCDQQIINDWNVMEDIESRRADESDTDEFAPLKKMLRYKLREIMMAVDLDEVTSKYLREKLEEETNLDLKDHKQFIGEEMVVILQQMDSPSQIFDFLYLGSEWNAANYDELLKNGIKGIVNVTREIDNFFPGQFTYHNIRVYDEDTTDLMKHWELAHRFINGIRQQGGNVLVHCKMGVSRSASTVIAYAMKERQMSLDEAIKFVKRKRGVIQPNAGFLRQLRTYEGILDASRHIVLFSRHRIHTWSTSSTSSAEGERRNNVDTERGVLGQLPEGQVVDQFTEDDPSDTESASTVFSDLDIADVASDVSSADCAEPRGESVTLIKIRSRSEGDLSENLIQNAPLVVGDTVPAETAVSVTRAEVQQQRHQSRRSPSGNRRRTRRASYDVDMFEEERRRIHASYVHRRLVTNANCLEEVDVHPDMLIEGIFRQQRYSISSAEASASIKLKPDSSWIHLSARKDDNLKSEGGQQRRCVSECSTDGYEGTISGSALDLTQLESSKTAVNAVKQQWLQMEQKQLVESSSASSLGGVKDTDSRPSSVYDAEDLALEPGLVMKTKLQLESKDNRLRVSSTDKSAPDSSQVTRSQSMKMRKPRKKHEDLLRRRTLEYGLTAMSMSRESSAEPELRSVDLTLTSDDETSSDCCIEEGSVRKRAQGFESSSTADEGEKELVADTRVIRSGSVRKQRQEIEAWGKRMPVRKIFDDVASDSTENKSSLATDNSNDNVDAADYDSDAFQAREHVKSLKRMLMSNIREIGKKLIPRLDKEQGKSVKEMAQEVNAKSDNGTGESGGRFSFLRKSKKSSASSSSNSSGEEKPRKYSKTNWFVEGLVRESSTDKEIMPPKQVAAPNIASDADGPSSAADSETSDSAQLPTVKGLVVKFESGDESISNNSSMSSLFGLETKAAERPVNVEFKKPMSRDIRGRRGPNSPMKSQSLTEADFAKRGGSRPWPQVQPAVDSELRTDGAAAMAAVDTDGTNCDGAEAAASAGSTSSLTSSATGKKSPVQLSKLGQFFIPPASALAQPEPGSGSPRKVRSKLGKTHPLTRLSRELSFPGYGPTYSTM